MSELMQLIVTCNVVILSVYLLFVAEKAVVRQVMIANYTDSDIRFVILLLLKMCFDSF